MRYALSLPQHDLFHAGIYNGYQHPDLAEEDNMEDEDHKSEEGAHNNESNTQQNDSNT